MSRLTYEHLLNSDLPAEARVRQSLALLEDHFRRAALLALSDWTRTGIVDPSLYLAIAGLQRPSWGSWNGLLRALRKVRKGVLTEGHAEARARVLQAQILSALLDLLQQRLDAAMVQALKPLCALLRATMSRRAKVQHALDIAITLRNRVAHDASVKLAWWEDIAEAMRPLMRWHHAAEASAQDPHPTLGGVFSTIEWRHKKLDERAQAPWFTTRDTDAIWSFNGVAKDFAVIYTHPMNGSEFDSTQTQSFFEAIQQLLGQQAMRERDLKRLLAHAIPEDLKGVLLGELLIGRPIGEGGAATVHIGRQLSTGRKVAVKLLRDGVSEEARLRFQKEAAFLSKFKHPHIVGVIGYGEDVWRTSKHISLRDEPWFDTFRRGAAIKSYIILEWIEGETLEHLFTQKARPDLKTLTRWFAQVAAALAVVHNSGLIHRDVKPGNVMVASSSTDSTQLARLMDFGIARNQSHTRTFVTSTGAVLGTDAYMPPEQLRSAYTDAELVGPTADIYSLCATFYELMTNTRLYAHEHARADLVRERKLKGEPPTRPRSIVPGFPWALETILMGGLQAEPTDRYRSAAALERDLRHVLADEPIEYRRPNIAKRARLFYRRSAKFVHASATVFLFFIAGIILYVNDIQRAQKFAAAAAVKAEISQKETVKALAEVNLQLAFLHEEEGRRAFFEGHNDTALVYLSRAYSLGHDAVSIRYLLARVSQRMNAQALVLNGHTAEVNEVVWSPNGDFIATASDDKTARLWDAQNGALLWTRAHDDSSQHIFFSPDGRWLVTQNTNQTALWDVKTGAPFEALTQRDSIDCLVVSFGEDDKIYAVTNHWRAGHLSLELWRGGQKETEISLGDKNFLRVAISPNGKRLLHTDKNGDHATLINLDTLEVIKKLSTSSAEIGFTPRGDYAWHRGLFDDTYKIFDATDGQLVADFMRGNLSIQSGAFNQNRALEILNYNQFIIKDLNKQRPDVTTSAASGLLSLAAFSADGSMLAGLSEESLVWLWKTEDGALLSTIDHGDAVKAMALDTQGDRLVTVGSHRRALVWAIKKQNLQTHLVRGSSRTALSFQRNGRGVWLGGDEGLIEFIKLPEGRSEHRQQLDTTKPIEIILTSPDHHHILVIDDSAHAWILNETGDVIAQLGNIASTQNIAMRYEGLLQINATFSPDGLFVAITHGADAFSIWTMKGEHVKTIHAHDSDITSIAWSASGDHIALSGEGVRVWSPQGEIEYTFSTDGVTTTHLAFSSEGDVLAVALEGGLVKIFDAHSGQEIATLNGHGGAKIRGIIFSKNKQLITIADDAKALVWSTHDWTLHAMLDHFNSANDLLGIKSEDRLLYVTLSPNRDLLATATVSGDVLIWDIKRGRLLERHHGRGRPSALAFSSDGRWLAVTTKRYSRAWAVGLETRSPKEIAAVAQRATVAIQNGIIVPKTIQRTQ